MILSELFEKYKEFENKNSQTCKPHSTLFRRIENLNITSTVMDRYLQRHNNKRRYRWCWIIKYGCKTNYNKKPNKVDNSLEQEYNKLKEEIRLLKE